MRSSLLATVITCCVTAHTGSSAEPVKPPEKLTAALASYDKAVAKAKDTSDDAARSAGEEYKKQLAAIMDEETKAGRLDAALLVRDEIKRIEKNAPPPSNKVRTAAELQNVLEGTYWEWDAEPLVLQAKGVVRQKGWEKSRLGVQWEAIDRRTVVMEIIRGRDRERVAILKFTEALDAFSGYDFDNRVLDTKKRIDSGKK